MIYAWPILGRQCGVPPAPSWTRQPPKDAGANCANAQGQVAAMQGKMENGYKTWRYNRKIPEEVSSAENLSNTSYWHHIDIYWLMFQPLLWREQKWVWNILNALRPSPKHTRLKTWGGWMCAPKTSGGAAFLTPSSYHVESFGWDQTLRHTEWFVVWTRKSWTKQVLPEIVPIACKDFQQLSQQCCTSYRGLCYRPICHFVISPFGLWIETCWWIIVSHMYVPST